MTLEKIIKKLENSSLEERMEIGKNQAHIYYSFCMKYTNHLIAARFFLDPIQIISDK